MAVAATAAGFIIHVGSLESHFPVCCLGVLLRKFFALSVRIVAVIAERALLALCPKLAEHRLVLVWVWRRQFFARNARHGIGLSTHVKCLLATSTSL